MAGLWPFAVVALLGLCCSPIDLLSAQPDGDGFAAGAEPGAPADRVADRAAAANDPLRGVSVSGLFPPAGGPPIQPAGPLKWAIDYAGKRIPFYSSQQKSHYRTAAGRAAIMEQQPTYTLQEFIDKRIYERLHNADGSPKYKEVGPEMFCHEPKTGKVVNYGKCWALPEIREGDRPKVWFLENTGMGFWVSKSTSLARFYLVADPVTRQDMIDMLAQGKVPEASHLCGHGWCVNWAHIGCELSAANLDRYQLCRQLQVFVDEDGHPINPCCHIHADVPSQCLAALPANESMGNV